MSHRVYVTAVEYVRINTVCSPQKNNRNVNMHISLEQYREHHSALYCRKLNAPTSQRKQSFQTSS